MKLDTNQRIYRKSRTKEMTVRQKSYKFRIYPTKEQTVMFSKTFGYSRLSGI